MSAKLVSSEKRKNNMAETNLDERRPSGLLCLGDNVGTCQRTKRKTNERVVSDLGTGQISVFERNPGRTEGGQGGLNASVVDDGQRGNTPIPSHGPRESIWIVFINMLLCVRTSRWSRTTHPVCLLVVSLSHHINRCARPAREGSTLINRSIRVDRRPVRSPKPL